MDESNPPNAGHPSGADSRFSRTMRLDIAPDVVQQPGVSPARPRPVRRVRVVRKGIRVPAVHPPLGDSDFQQMFQSVYDAALICDSSGRIREANARAVQFLGYTRDELCAGNVTDVISGADAVLPSTMWETTERDRFVLIQAWCERKDGTLFPSEISVNRLRVAGAEYLCFFIRDITLRQQAEEQLRIEHNAVQNAGNGIAIADLDGYLTYANPAALRMWGFDKPDHAHGQHLRELLSNPDLADQVVEAVVEDGCWLGEAEAHRLDGTAFYMQVSATVNVDADERLTGMVFSFLDITARRLAEQQVDQYARQLMARNTQIEDDMAMARDIQLALLPQRYPAFPHDAAEDTSALHFCHLYRPSSAVGGDFFTVFPVNELTAGLFICDVMGHGIRAALVTAILHGIALDLRARGGDPGFFLTATNRKLISVFRQPEQMLFATGLHLAVDLQRHVLRYASAGHTCAVLARRATESVHWLDDAAASGPALGIFDGQSYGVGECPLLPGDVLLLYTDGLLEAENPDGEEYGGDRLIAAVKARLALTPDALIKGVVDDVAAFTRQEHFADDICVLAAEVVRFPDPASAVQ